MSLGTFRRIFAVVPAEDRPMGLAVFVLICVSALFQIVGILSVIPFLLAISDPATITGSERFGWVTDILNFDSTFDLQIFMGLASFVTILFAGSLRIATFYAQAYFLQMQRYSLSRRLMRGYLSQPYLYFLEHKASDLIKSVLAECNLFIDRALVPASTIFSSGLQALALLILLFVVEPTVAAITAVFLGGTFALIYFWAQPRLTRYGQERHKADADRVQGAIETLSGIKAVKLSGKELRFAERFEHPSREANTARIRSSVISQVPRHLIEAVAYGGMVLLALFAVVRSNSEGTSLGTTVVPILVIYAFAGYRLLPAFQSIYTSFATLRFMDANVRDITAQLNELAHAKALQEEPPQLKFRTALELDSVSFTYPNREKGAVHDLCLTLPIGTSLGIVGRSGAGKTTLVDLLLGLLRPSAGEIRVNGTALGPTNRRAWQRSLGYVPQDIFLTGRSVAENIAFGVPRAQIDMEQVVRCAKMVQIHDFILADLPQGYETEIGDRGAHLSGGQRQRIGIARALYLEPQIVVFDEATSALDTITEAAVLSAINLLKETKTVIIVSHRMSAVEGCDQIAVLEAGQLVGLDSFDGLSRTNPQFQNLLAESGSTPFKVPGKGMPM